LRCDTSWAEAAAGMDPTIAAAAAMPIRRLIIGPLPKFAI